MINIVLASASPRRKEILENTLGINPEIIVSGVEETVNENQSSGDMVLDLAMAKGVVVAENHKDSVVISGDTIVALKRTILGKPKDEEDAIATLKSLSGQCHQGYTGQCVFYNGNIVKGLSTSNVYFKELSENEILKYVVTGEPLDKAGGYGIQGPASTFIKKIEGDFYGIMGFSPYIINELFERLSIVM